MNVVIWWKKYIYCSHFETIEAALFDAGGRLVVNWIELKEIPCICVWLSLFLSETVTLRWHAIFVVIRQIAGLMCIFLQIGKCRLNISLPTIIVLSWETNLAIIFKNSTEVGRKGAKKLLVGHAMPLNWSAAAVSLVPIQ